MTPAARAAILAEACRWQAEEPDRRIFIAESRPAGLTIRMEIWFGYGREEAEATFWESTPDADLTPEYIRRRIDAAWREALTP